MYFPCMQAWVLQCLLRPEEVLDCLEVEFQMA